jgi:hypothetical protein
MGDYSPEFQMAGAPLFMYVPGTRTFKDQSYNAFAEYAQNLVRYYNKGGFTGPDGPHISPGNRPITWWGIYNEPDATGMTPQQYVGMYNKVVLAMQAVDPSLKFISLELGAGFWAWSTISQRSSIK